MCTVLVKTTGHKFIANYITQYVNNDNSSGSVLWLNDFAFNQINPALNVENVKDTCPS